ncbi:MAG TPA: hypothetical protein VLQ48_14995 [Chloroflexia bacterium]|nr:hypothetical protein [Chloroflexia bacterium]
MLSIQNKSKDYHPTFTRRAFVFAILIGGGLLLFLTSGDNGAAVASQATGTVSAAQSNTLASQAPAQCSIGSDYIVTRTTGATIVPGKVRTPIDCRMNCSETIDLPFPFTLYDRTFTTAIVGSNGILGFDSNDNFYQPSCLPSNHFSYAILPVWELMPFHYSLPDPSKGVFTSVTGTAPNRIFNIEWRMRDPTSGGALDFELRLYENSPTKRFDIIYGYIDHHGGHGVVGVQKDIGSQFTDFSCLVHGNIDPGVQLVFAQPTCPTPVPSTRTNPNGQ